MDDLERQLSSLALRGPSADLDRRVMEALALSDTPQSLGVTPSGGISSVVPIAAAPPSSPRPRAAVSWRWALAAAMLMGALGFLAGRLTLPSPTVPAPLASAPFTVPVAAPSAAPAVTVQVIYEGSAPNPFDCTVAADDGLRPVQGIQIISNSGV